MIPKNISRYHILQAIQEINKNGVPPNRDSRQYSLNYLGRLLPPKYVVSLANDFANGEMLSSNIFNGGLETNSFLASRGFEIINKQSSSHIKDTKIRKKELNLKPKKKHNERCQDCKKTIKKMLKSIYGSVEPNYNFEAGVLPDDFSDSTFCPDLRTIYQSLQRHRSYESFVRTSRLPRVDYFVPTPGFIVEFDESQHFTECRKQALLHYPKDLDVGFDVNRWITICEKIQAKDNKPPFRDEQRAWYDTLRDFLPSILPLSPTVRLYSKSFHWCSLDPNITHDQEKFKAMIEGELPNWNIEVRSDPKPSLARIIIDGDWEGDVENSKKIFHDILDIWPADKTTDVIITCGAFLTFKWQESLPYIEDNKFPDDNAIKQLILLAEKQCNLFIDEELRSRLIAHTDYITIGIDSRKESISLSNVSIRQHHIELVTLIDLNTREYHWTGKSYPTTGQENGLVRFQDLDTHFVHLPLGKIMLLGCHDLNIFSPRGAAVTKNKWRKQIRTDFYNLAVNEKPDIVLHHPHTTDASGIWTSAWNEVLRKLPSVKLYMSAGRYFNDGAKKRSPLNDVLLKTKMGSTLDFIIWSEND